MVILPILNSPSLLIESIFCHTFDVVALAVSSDKDPHVLVER